MKAKFRTGMEILIAALAFSMAAASGAVDEFDVTFKAALTAYQKKDYKTAKDLFWKSITQGNPTALVWLYEGHCYYAMRDTANAIKTYRTITTTFKSTPEARSAAQYLRMLDPYNKWTEPKAKLAASARVAGLSETIEIVRPVANHPAVSPETIATVTRAIAHVPPRYYKFLSEGGARVHITCNLDDRWPDARTTGRPGAPGETLATCPARTYGHDIWICERPVDAESNQAKEAYSQDSIECTTLHECGHAIDDLLGVYSKSPEFKKVYNEDVAQLSDSDKTQLQYFLQSDMGSSEVCAESTAKLFGATGNSTGEMQTYFPKTFAAVKRKLNL